jgi:DNA-binding transcriptional LysR family regulator
MDLFTALKSYNLVVEHRSFSKAAKDRYASASALSKHIAWLEHELGHPLLHRTPRQFAITEEGEALYKKSKLWLNEYDDFKSSLNNNERQLSGRLRVTSPRTFGSSVLVDHLPDFNAKHPDIMLDITFDNEYIDIIDNEIDVAIRVGEISGKHLKSEVIGHKSCGIFASPAYLEAAHKIKKIKDILEHPCLVHRDFSRPDLWRFKKDTLSITPSLMTNSLSLLIKSALAGHGLLYISEYTVKKYVESGALLPVLESQWQDKIKHSIVYPRRTFINKKTSVFIDFIKTVAW